MTLVHIVTLVTFTFTVVMLLFDVLGNVVNFLVKISQLSFMLAYTYICTYISNNVQLLIPF